MGSVRCEGTCGQVVEDAVRYGRDNRWLCPECLEQEAVKGEKGAPRSLYGERPRRAGGTRRASKSSRR